MSWQHALRYQTGTFQNLFQGGRNNDEGFQTFMYTAKKGRRTQVKLVDKEKGTLDRCYGCVWFRDVMLGLR